MKDSSKKKMGFFKRVFYSIKDFDIYREYVKEPVSTAVLYFLKLILLFSIIFSCATIFGFVKSMNSVLEYFREEFPDFTYSDYTLSVNSEPFIIDDKESNLDYYIIVDTNPTEEKLNEYRDRLALIGSGILILDDKIIFKNADIEFTEYYSSSPMPFTEISSKEEALSLLSENQMFIYVSIAMVLVLSIIAWFVIILLIIYPFVFILAALLTLINQMFVVKLNFKEMFNICTYSFTLSIVLAIICFTVLILTGFVLKYFNILFIVLAYIYSITAILNIMSYISKNPESQGRLNIEEIEKEDRYIDVFENREENEENLENEENDTQEENDEEVK